MVSLIFPSLRTNFHCVLKKNVMVKTQFQILKSVSKYILNCLESRFVYGGSISGSQRNRLKLPGNKKYLNSGPIPYSIKNQKVRCSSAPSVLLSDGHFLLQQKFIAFVPRHRIF